MVLSLAAFMVAVAGEGACRPTLIWVEVPAARADPALRLGEAGHLPWLGAAIARDTFWRLTDTEVASLDSVRSEMRGRRSPVIDIGWTGSRAAGEMRLSLSASLRQAECWVTRNGQPSADLLAGWGGEVDWPELRRIAGIDESLRWEEIEEFLSLSPKRSRSLRALPATPDHPLWRMRRAFSADKFFANAALYFGRAEEVSRLFLIQDLARVYEQDLLPWTERQLLADPCDRGDLPASQRRFFLHRLRSSRPRIYGRIDRVLQSLQAVWGDEAIVIVDASRSLDPFLAIGTTMQPGGGRGPIDNLHRLLDQVGWGEVSDR